MIERLNFYDVYGFLLPGLALTILLYLPYGLVLGRWDAPGLAFGVAALAVAYLAGHVLHELAHSALPTRLNYAAATGERRLRAPTSYLLDRSNGKLSIPQREGVIDALNDAFGQGVTDADDPDENQERRRNGAALQARAFLLAAGRAEYTEQMQGMYALNRGLALTGWIAAYHQAGLFLVASLPDAWRAFLGTGLNVITLPLLVFTAVGLAWPPQPTLARIAYPAFALGVWGGAQLPDIGRRWAVMLVLLLVGAVVYAIANRAFRRFSETWAQTLLRDFSVAAGGAEKARS